MIKYYPSSRILTGSYTNGGDYTTPDGASYTGFYYILYDGSTYTGKNPVTGTNQELTPIAVGSTLSSNLYSPLKANNSNPPANLPLQSLTSYFPKPTESDYTTGYFTRYFAKNVTGLQYVIEISPNDWSNIQNGNVAPNILSYETTSLFWQLTGPLHDTRISQYQVKGGVYDTNKRVTESTAKGFVGLLAFINNNYTKFARISN